MYPIDFIISDNINFPEKFQLIILHYSTKDIFSNYLLLKQHRNHLCSGNRLFCNQWYEWWAVWMNYNYTESSGNHWLQLEDGEAIQLTPNMLNMKVSINSLSCQWRECRSILRNTLSCCQYQNLQIQLSLLK